MERAVDKLILFCLIIAWIMGIAIAKGWWTLLAMFFPLYSWYLVVEKFINGC